MFFKIINYLNSKKNFPYYISTPIVYGIGGASEHIAMVASHAKRASKKILIFKTRYFQKFLNMLFHSLLQQHY